MWMRGYCLPARQTCEIRSCGVYSLCLSRHEVAPLREWDYWGSLSPTDLLTSARDEWPVLVRRLEAEEPIVVIVAELCHGGRVVRRCRWIKGDRVPEEAAKWIAASGERRSLSGGAA